MEKCVLSLEQVQYIEKLHKKRKIKSVSLFVGISILLLSGMFNIIAAIKISTIFEPSASLVSLFSLWYDKVDIDKSYHGYQIEIMNRISNFHMLIGCIILLIVVFVINKKKENLLFKCCGNLEESKQNN